jgi:hypothetical protein
MLNFVSDRASLAGARLAAARIAIGYVPIAAVHPLEESCSRNTPLDLLKLLPRLLPPATGWIQTQEAKILASGRPLSETETKLAVLAGARSGRHSV